MTHAVELSEIVRNYGLIVGGFIGICVAFWRGYANQQAAKAATKQARIADRTHASDLFSKAVEGLQAENLEVLLGSVYTLRQVARDYPEFAVPVLRVLQLTLKRVRKVQNQEQSDMVVKEIARTINDVLSNRDVS